MSEKKTVSYQISNQGWNEWQMDARLTEEEMIDNIAEYYGVESSEVQIKVF